jgi:hypothetical protein
VIRHWFIRSVGSARNDRADEAGYVSLARQRKSGRWFKPLSLLGKQTKTGMKSIDEVADGFVRESLEDYVGLWTIAPAVLGAISR